MSKKHSTRTEDDEFDTTDNDSYNDVVFEEEGSTQADTVKKLREQLKACRKEKQEYLEGWQRMKADIANIRKDAEEDRKNAQTYANEAFISELLPVLDSFDMAFANKRAWENVDAQWRAGVEYIYSQLRAALERSGVAFINPEGEPFDHELHSSLEAVPTDDPAQDNIVAEVMQKGYALHGKVVRPAKVKVYVAQT